MRTYIKEICLCVLLASCAGYNPVNSNNPLSQYGIRSVSIPSFMNQSSLANASSSFTREFFLKLNSFRGLKVSSGFNPDADAVLIGIVESEKSFANTVKNDQQRIVTTVAPNNIGTKRNDFYVPASTNVQLKVRLMLLKKPTNEELELLRSKYASTLRGNNKIIFNEVITVSETFNREIFDNKAGQVNFTQNYGMLERSIGKMAKKASDQFEESVLYAF